MDPEILQLADSVQKALEIFYSSGEDGAKDHAHRVLREIRSSNRADQLAWLLLSDLTKVRTHRLFTFSQPRPSVNMSAENGTRWARKGTRDILLRFSRSWPSTTKLIAFCTSSFALWLLISCFVLVQVKTMKWSLCLMP
eukprot:scpid26322/ scgid34910/ 